MSSKASRGALAGSTLKVSTGKRAKSGSGGRGPFTCSERQREQPLVHRISAPLQGLVELGGGVGEVAQAVVGGAHFAQRGHALIQRDVAPEFLLVVADGLAETAAARERVAHQKVGGGLFVAIGQRAVDDLFQQVDGAVQADQRIVRHAVSALLREAHLAGHPLAEVQQEGVGVGLQFGDAGGEFVGEIGIVVEQLGARVNHGLGAQRRDVVGIVL